MRRINIKYEFYPHGTNKEHDDDSYNEIWLDIGNTIGKTVIDHHGDNPNKYGSSVLALSNAYDAIRSSLEKAEKTGNITIATHVDPDLDALTCIFLIKEFFSQDGANYADRWKKVIEKYNKLIVYSDNIDNGKNKRISLEKISLASAFQVLKCIEDNNFKNKGSNKEEEYNQIISDGLDLLKKSALSPDDITDQENLGFISNFLREDYNKYLSEKYRVVRFKMINGMKAALWNKPSNSNFGYQWARDKDNAELTFFPMLEDGKSRVIIALNRNIISDNDHSKDLQVLAEFIERREQIIDRIDEKESGYYRRDYSSSRKGDLMSKKPFSFTSDPWYCNIDSGIIDAPHSLSLQSIDDLYYYTENISELEVNKENWILDNDHAHKSKQDFDISNNYCVIYVEVSPAVLKHDNMMLEYLCHEAAGDSYLSENDSRILQYDYYTCIYAAENCTVVAYTGDYRNSENRNNVSPRNRIIKNDGDKESLALNILKIYKEKKALSDKINEIGELMKDVTNQRKSERKVLNEMSKAELRITDLMTSIRASVRGIKKPFEKEAIDFVRKQLSIESLEDDLYQIVQLAHDNLSQKIERKRSGWTKAWAIIAIILTILSFVSSINDGLDLHDKIVHYKNETSEKTN